jgi:N-methylhydantoinase A
MNMSTTAPTSQRTSIAIDIGGTFTDVVTFDSQTGQIFNSKVSSTPQDQSIGFDDGVLKGLEVSGKEPADISQLLHGTTVATNLILEGKGAQCALLTTAGFRHVLEIARHDIPRKSNLYSWSRAARPVQPDQIFEVAGRMGPDGAQIDPLAEEDVRRAARRLKARGILAVAICFLHAYANAAHERRAREVFLEEHPEALLSISSDILPVFREYERALVTILNSYVMPSVSTYVGRLETRMQERQIHAPLLLMKSSGGVTGTREIKVSPVQTALSGPAAGIVGAAFIGEASGFRDLITIDIGGTSADICLIKDGKPNTTTNTRIGEWPISLPMIDIHTIGAGGGSIASVSSLGGLTVGPRSAGAVPGPVCYMRGGTEPTVTDAHLVLGHLPPYLLQGSLGLDRDKAVQAIRTRVAEPLGLDVEEAARGILAVVDNNMVGAIRVVSVERGHNPSDFVLLPFGGAGPLHSSALAQLLGIRRILVPPAPGVLSALGLMVSDLRSDYARTCLQRPPHYRHEEMEDIFLELEANAQDWFVREGLQLQSRATQRTASLRYQGQGFELTVPWHGRADENTTRECLQRFHALHRQLYTFAQEDAPVELVTLGVTAVGTLSRPTLPRLPTKTSVQDAIVGTQPVFFQDGLRECPVYDRRLFGASAELVGPAIVSQLDATTLIGPGQRMRVDEVGSMVIDLHA